MEKIVVVLLVSIVTLSLSQSSEKPKVNCQSCNSVNSHVCCKEQSRCCIPRSQSSHGSSSTHNQTYFTCNQSLCLRDGDCASKKCQINQPKFCIPKKVLQYFGNSTTPRPIPTSSGNPDNEPERGEETEGGDQETEGKGGQETEEGGDQETEGKGGQETEEGEGQETKGEGETSQDETPGEEEAEGTGTGEEEAKGTGTGDEETSQDETPGEEEAEGTETGDEETSQDETPGEEEAEGTGTGDEETSQDETPGEEEAEGTETGDEEEKPQSEDGEEESKEEQAEAEDQTTERRKRDMIIKHHISISTCNDDKDCGSDSVCKEYDIGCCSID
uniref:WAP domain-containing protein n=1 Tax=Strigamia maritima TaxID=126957 RepID=T1J5I6_STRMM